MEGGVPHEQINMICNQVEKERNFLEELEKRRVEIISNIVLRIYKEKMES